MKTNKDTGRATNGPVLQIVLRFFEPAGIDRFCIVDEGGLVCDQFETYEEAEAAMPELQGELEE